MRVDDVWRATFTGPYLEGYISAEGGSGEVTVELHAKQSGPYGAGVTSGAGELTRWARLLRVEEAQQAKDIRCGPANVARHVIHTHRKPSFLELIPWLWLATSARPIVRPATSPTRVLNPFSLSKIASYDVFIAPSESKPRTLNPKP